MNLEQYNTASNPFLGLSKMLSTKDSGGKASLGHALIMNQVHHAGVMEHLERSHELQSAENKVAHRREMARQRIGHAQALELESLKAQNASAISAQTHAQTIEAATHQAGIAETAATSTHQRNLELIKGIKGAAKPGTKINLASGDVRAEFTTKEPKPRAPKAESNPAAPIQKGGPVSLGMPSMPVIKATPASPAKPSGVVGRDPNTGRAMSLKSGEVKPAKKSSSKKATVAGAQVGRDPKTGRAISLKK